jgi:D-alanine-D-alanine ligase
LGHRVGIILGGPSPEHDVSVITGLQASHALADRGHDVEALYWSKTGEWWSIVPRSETTALAKGVPSDAAECHLESGQAGGFFKTKWKRRVPVELDVVVNCCHGGPGEDGTLQATLDLAGVRYTGPSQLQAAIGMDKLAFGALAQSQGLPTLPRIAYYGEPHAEPEFPPPYIVKPRYGGSSIGIEVVDDFDALKAVVTHSVHLRQGAVVEPYLRDAADLNIGIRTFPQLELSAIERPLRGGSGSHILGFADKYTAVEGMAGAPRELPANLSDEQRDTIERCASAIARLLPVRGACRLDFLVHEDRVLVNEINTIPGSFGKYLWIEPERPFAVLLEDMIAEALDKPTYRPNTAGSDGTLLHDAGSISRKLA